LGKAESKLKVPKLEPQIELLVGTFSHELAKHLDFAVHRSGANLPRTPPRPFHQLLLLLGRSALPIAQSLLQPCSRRANLTFCTCLLAAGMAQSTSMVSILNKRSCCWVLQLRPRSDFDRLVLARSKLLGNARTLSDRARRVLHL